MQPRNTGRYCEIFLGRHRRDDLRATHTHGNPLPAIPDNAATADAIMRRARNLGPTPREALRRLLDDECTKTAKRLQELSK
jgi:hypothetical protein